MRFSKILKTTKGIKKISDKSDGANLSEIQISGSRALPLMGEVEGALWRAVAFLFPSLYFLSTKYSAIWTALRAAPLRIWSPVSQSVRPFSLAKSLRTRPT